MPKPLPNVTPVEASLPEETPRKDVPEGFKIKTNTPNPTEQKKETPEATQEKDSIPEESKPKEEMPSDFIEENCVVVGGNKIEIKPTKLKYFRNKAASGYGIIKVVPIHELYTYDKGVLDPDRSADQLVYDFLVAAFNDATFIRDNYNELDADILDKVVKIFGRLNHIDEKEEAARKNKEAQAQAKR